MKGFHMRRAALVGALIALPLAALATPAQAANGHGASISKGKDGTSGTCFQALRGFTETRDFVSVTTPSGNTTLTCHFTDVANPPDKTLKFDGFSCSTFAGSTTDTSFVVTPSGNGTLVCQIKK